MKAIINQLIQDKQLSKEQARQVIINMADGHYNTSQIAAFLTVFISANTQCVEVISS